MRGMKGKEWRWKGERRYGRERWGMRKRRKEGRGTGRRKGGKVREGRKERNKGENGRERKRVEMKEDKGR